MLFVQIPDVECFEQTLANLLIFMFCSPIIAIHFSNKLFLEKGNLKCFIDNFITLSLHCYMLFVQIPNVECCSIVFVLDHYI
jgi:hypothetical protein